jgi:NAD(P)-dependent dehydrogenase (short-subunit alcohol dehydrogenase family)
VRRRAAEFADLGRPALPVAAHVGHWDDLSRLTEAAYAEFGRVDVLVNNAGMSPLAPSSEETSEELFDKVIGVNFKGPFRLASTEAESAGRLALVETRTCPAARCQRYLRDNP